MSFIITHATAKDLDTLRHWLNDASDLAWIIKTGQSESTHYWRAISQIDRIDQQDYALWSVPSGPLNIPSGVPGVPDAIVKNPFAGWSQTMEGVNTAPWFGDNLPGPYSVSFRPQGRERPNSIGRSGFHWALDRFKLIGKPAHPAAKSRWQQLRRFIAKSATRLPWPDASSRHSTFVFPDALEQYEAGRHLDINP